jgi:Acetyltransferases
MTHSIPAAIRKAGIEDIESIMKIEYSAFHSEIVESEKTFKDRIKTFGDGFLVAEIETGEGKAIAGYISSELWEYSKEIRYSNFNLNHSICETHKTSGNELYISSIAVDPTVRGKNIGKRLFEELLKTVSEKYRLKSAILIVNSEWKSAFEMYQKNGFEIVAEIPNFFLKNEEQDSQKMTQGNGKIMRRLF